MVNVWNESTVKAAEFKANPSWFKTPGRIAVAVVYGRELENRAYFGKGAANDR